MKKKLLTIILSGVLTGLLLSGCSVDVKDAPAETQAPEEESAGETETEESAAEEEPAEDTADAVSDEDRAKEVADLIDAIYVQERTDETDELCKKAKEAWDALTDGIYGDMPSNPMDYFGRDTGDASKDDPLNADDIGDNEILVVSFGTSFNDSRAEDISGIEKAIAAANPDWSVRRAFTAHSTAR